MNRNSELLRQDACRRAGECGCSVSDTDRRSVYTFDGKPTLVLVGTKVYRVHNHGGYRGLVRFRVPISVLAQIDSVLFGLYPKDGDGLFFRVPAKTVLDIAPADARFFWANIPPVQLPVYRNRKTQIPWWEYRVFA